MPASVIVILDSDDDTGAGVEADSPPQCALPEHPPATPSRQRAGPLPCQGHTAPHPAARPSAQIAAEHQPTHSLASGRGALDLAPGHSPRPHSPVAANGPVPGNAAGHNDGDVLPAEPPKKKRRLESTPVPHPGPHVHPSDGVRAGAGARVAVTPAVAGSGPAGAPKPLGPVHGGPATPSTATPSTAMPSTAMPSTAARRAVGAELHASPAVMREWLGRSSGPVSGSHAAAAGAEACAAATGSTHRGGPAGPGGRVTRSPLGAGAGARGDRNGSHGSGTAAGGGRRIGGATQINGNPLAGSPVGAKDGWSRGRLSMGRGTPGDCPATPGTSARGGGPPSGPGLAAQATAGAGAGAGATLLAAREQSLAGQTPAGGVADGGLTGTPSLQAPGVAGAGGCAGEALGGQEEAAPSLAAGPAAPAAMAAAPAGTGGTASATIGTNAPTGSGASEGGGAGAPSSDSGATGGPGPEGDPGAAPLPSRGPSPGPSIPRPVRQAAKRANNRITRTFEAAKTQRPPQHPQQQQQHSRPPRPFRSRTPDSIGNAGGSVAAGQAAAGAGAAGAGSQGPHEGQLAQGQGPGPAGGGGGGHAGEVVGGGGVQPCFYMLEEALRQRRELGPAAASEAAPGTPLYALEHPPRPAHTPGLHDPNPAVVYCNLVPRGTWARACNWIKREARKGVEGTLHDRCRGKPLVTWAEGSPEHKGRVDAVGHALSKMLRDHAAEKTGAPRPTNMQVLDNLPEDVPCHRSLRAVPVGSQEAGASPWDHVLEMQGQLSVKGEEDIPAAEESGCFLGLYAGEMMLQGEYEKRRDDGRRAVFADREVAAAADAGGQGAAAGGSCALGGSCLEDARLRGKEWALRNESYAMDKRLSPLLLAALREAVAREGREAGGSGGGAADQEQRGEAAALLAAIEEDGHCADDEPLVMATSAVFGNLLALANDPHLLQQGPVEGVTHGGQGQQQAGAAGQAGQSSAAAPDGIRRVCNMEGGPNVIVHTYFILNLLPVFVMIPLRTIRRGEHLGYDYGRDFWDMERRCRQAVVECKSSLLKDRQLALKDQLLVLALQPLPKLTHTNAEAAALAASIQEHKGQLVLQLLQPRTAASLEDANRWLEEQLAVLQQETQQLKAMAQAHKQVLSAPPQASEPTACGGDRDQAPSPGPAPARPLSNSHAPSHGQPHAAAGPDGVPVGGGSVLMQGQAAVEGSSREEGGGVGAGLGRDGGRQGAGGIAEAEGGAADTGGDERAGVAAGGLAQDAAVEGQEAGAESGGAGPGLSAEYGRHGGSRDGLAGGRGVAAAEASNSRDVEFAGEKMGVRQEQQQSVGSTDGAAAANGADGGVSPGAGGRAGHPYPHDPLPGAAEAEAGNNAAPGPDRPPQRPADSSTNCGSVAGEAPWRVRGSARPLASCGSVCSTGREPLEGPSATATSLPGMAAPLPAEAGAAPGGSGDAPCEDRPRGVTSSGRADVQGHGGGRVAHAPVGSEGCSRAPAAAPRGGVRRGARAGGAAGLAPGPQAGVGVGGGASEVVEEGEEACGALRRAAAGTGGGAGVEVEVVDLVSSDSEGEGGGQQQQQPPPPQQQQPQGQQQQQADAGQRQQQAQLETPRTPATAAEAAAAAAAWEPRDPILPGGLGSEEALGQQQPPAPRAAGSVLAHGAGGRVGTARGTQGAGTRQAAAGMAPAVPPRAGPQQQQQRQQRQSMSGSRQAATSGPAPPSLPATATAAAQQQGGQHSGVAQRSGRLSLTANHQRRVAAAQAQAEAHGAAPGAVGSAALQHAAGPSSLAR